MKKTILIVEDEAGIARFTQQLLEKEGFVCQVCRDGATAVRYFFGDDRVVDTHVARLRKKIEQDPTHPLFIKTVVGTGYKFEDATE